MHPLPGHRHRYLPCHNYRNYIIEIHPIPHNKIMIFLACFEKLCYHEEVKMLLTMIGSSKIHSMRFREGGVL